ncbi:MAG TPA: HD domain-containing protein [Clostridia bacterium]|nr:HD domain-containing protein [Clostridia bacterium]
MLKKAFIELIYEAASIQRWNDHIRPHKGFSELDKQAHKMILAYVLAKYEECDGKKEINWLKIIEGGVFEFLHRIVLTDIKPPIYHKLMEKKGDKLNQWVLEQLNNRVEGIRKDFMQRFESYLFASQDFYLEKRILKAAHYLATNWEFKIIYNLNMNLYGLEDTKAKIENEIEEYWDLIGVQKLQLGKKTRNFLDLVGQLRFQQRWSQTPRIPETSVMGHMLVVAILAYLCSIELNACQTRVYNNFFAGLFHDLPEVLTRDIVSPIKRSVEGLEELIKEIESQQLEEKIFPLLPVSWHKEIKYFTENELKNKIIENGKIKFVTEDEIGKKYNEDKYHPLDGEIIKACDHFAAYIEAYLSINYGIKSRVLEEGHKSLLAMYEGRKIGGIDFGKLYNAFKIN